MSGSIDGAEADIGSCVEAVMTAMAVVDFVDVRFLLAIWCVFGVNMVAVVMVVPNVGTAVLFAAFLDPNEVVGFRAV